MNFLHCIQQLLRLGHPPAGPEAEQAREALGGLLAAQGERTEAAKATQVAAHSQIRAFEAEGARIQQRAASQAEKSGKGTTSYAKAQVENLLQDMDRDVARAVRGEPEDSGASE